MTDIVTAVYSLMGHPPEDKVDEEKIKEKVESIFNVSCFQFQFNQSRENAQKKRGMINYSLYFGTNI